MRVLVAMDKFKDALAAADACAVVARELAKQQPTWTVDVCPLSDGGEGFAEILTAAVGGAWHPGTVGGPRRERTVSTGFGLVPIAQVPARAAIRLDLPVDVLLAVVDLAGASGLQHLAPAERNPWHTTTAGTGEIIQAARAAGAGAVVLGLGGSATHDLGLGIMGAMGATVYDAAGSRVHDLTPNAWADIARWQAPAKGWPPLRLACDVTNPLLGLRGAAAVYAPQKGLRADDQLRLEAATARLADLLCAETRTPVEARDLPGAGAAGGTAFGLMVAAGARLVPGFTLVAEWLDLERRVQQADIVVTGEGCYDASSLEGKGPGAIADWAAAQGKPAWVLAGAVTASPPTDRIRAVAITPPGTDLPTALAGTRYHLARVTAELFG